MGPARPRQDGPGPAPAHRVPPGTRPTRGGWREGDPVGRRRWVGLEHPLELESGEHLPGVRLAYQTWGRLNSRRTNAVLVLHALTGDAHLTGPPGPGQPSPGWWEGIVGPGRALDTDRHLVVAPNVLGGCQGSTGPSSNAPDGRPWGSRFPRITLRDTVRAEEALADALGVDAWAAVIGGSMGGMRAMEWALTHPGRVRRALLLACPAATTAWQIACAAPQLHAVRADPDWFGGDYHSTGRAPVDGLGVARRIAHVTYRGAEEFDARFGRAAQRGEDPGAEGRYAVESYLDHQAWKLARRFDPASYVLLTEAMNGHDVGRGRGGVAAALATLPERTIVAGIDSDHLYPLSQQREIARHLPRPGQVRVIGSPHGHDGFLVETGQVAALVRELLADG
ncbi:homoserine O-acetyltransferase [Nocardiopsis sp. SBT366]|uniref:homoserine O-acetyltransferase MetX n=1 Tax=Nocardiopsis sp. SBT366 TaxID=1580529 RepID=UPI00066E01EC|nr:homoserine O-acetyltransferase [Nocardiopsis sp. SBT366]